MSEHPSIDADYPGAAYLTEGQVYAKAEYAALSPEEQAKVDQHWAALSEQAREDVRAEAEWELY